jgi:hypothetical protein
VEKKNLLLRPHGISNESRFLPDEILLRCIYTEQTLCQGEGKYLNVISDRYQSGGNDKGLGCRKKYKFAHFFVRL